MGLGRVTKSQLILYKELEGGCGDWEKDSDNLPFSLLGIVRKEGHGMIWKHYKELGRCLLYSGLNR